MSKRYLNFNKSTYKWFPDIDYRKHPEKYLVGKGEQGVLICNPYKSEILPFWKFATPQKAQVSSEKIYQLFVQYLDNKEFVGADMARKYLQMGFTRSRRYANWKGGKKYKDDGTLHERDTGDSQKIESANIFFKKWQEAEEHPQYKQMKKDWKLKYG